MGVAEEAYLPGSGGAAAGSHGGCKGWEWGMYVCAKCGPPVAGFLWSASFLMGDIARISSCEICVNSDCSQ